MVERRTSDADLARLARDQERELRAFLLGIDMGPGRDLEASLRAAADRWEQTYGGRAEVLVAPDLPALTPDQVGALWAAVGEALTNAGKHGGAARVTVYAEPEGDDAVFLSVKDDGSGFDPEGTQEGIGLSRSVRGRMVEAGGSASVRAAPGQGTEVVLRLPAGKPARRRRGDPAGREGR